MRQGGVLSPSLFAVCLDDLSACLSKYNTECYVNDTAINHNMYADDIIMFNSA